MSDDPATAPRGRRYAGASAAQRRADRYERLIRAAIAVYAEHGYRDATVAAVCRAAGLTPRYFYEAFANSQALLAAAFDEVAGFVTARITEVADATTGTPEDRLRALLAAYYELLRADPPAARVFLLEMSGIAPAIDERFAHSLDRFAELIARVLSPNGAAAPPLRRTGAIYGLLQVARSWVERGYAEPVGEVVEVALPLCRLLVERGR